MMNNHGFTLKSSHGALKMFMKEKLATKHGDNHTEQKTEQNVHH